MYPHMSDLAFSADRAAEMLSLEVLSTETASATAVAAVGSWANALKVNAITKKMSNIPLRARFCVRTWFFIVAFMIFFINLTFIDLNCYFMKKTSAKMLPDQKLSILRR